MAKKLARRDTLAERLASNYTVRINKLALSWRRDRLVNLSEEYSNVRFSSLSDLMELLSAQFGGEVATSEKPPVSPLCAIMLSYKTFPRCVYLHRSSPCIIRLFEPFVFSREESASPCTSSKITQLSESSRKTMNVTAELGSGCRRVAV